jgi:hypothetical protein
MTISSVPITYCTTSNSTGIIAQELGPTFGNITVNNTTGISYYYTSDISNMVTIGSGLQTSSGTISISNLGATTGAISGAGSGYEWNWKTPEEFIDAFPDMDRIKKMCEEYPGLKIAFEKFKTTYYLVKDHYDTPEDQRPLP